MDKIDLLKSRKAEILAAGSAIREKIALLTDEASFVESDSYSFSGNEFYDGTVGGEGVVTGSATMDGNAVYIVAQNAGVLSGGVTDANCDKIVKCQQKALRAGAPVIYILDSKGVAVGEGVNVLEGIGEVLGMANELKGECLQLAVVSGELFGSFSLLAKICDFTFMTKDACISYASPLVIASTSELKVENADVGGIRSSKKTGVATFKTNDTEETRKMIIRLLSVLPAYSCETETEDDLNRPAPVLNEKATASEVVKAVFDKDSFIELGKDFASEVITGIGRAGGIAVGAVVFDGGEKGVELTVNNITKIRDFLYFCDDSGLPVLTFVNTLGIKADINTAQSTIIREAAALSSALYCLEVPRINVVYGKAVGLGYTLFASKALGAEYSYAFATARISLFDTAQGAMIELAGVDERNKDRAEEKYADEVQDPINAAKKGYIDDIIEPQFARSYLIAALQLVVR